MGGLQKLMLLEQKLESFPTKVSEAVNDALDALDKTDLLEKMNVEQLNKGKRADGSEIEPAYRPKTRARKIKLGLNPDIVTLKDKNEFQPSIRTRRYPGKVELTATDKKAQQLSDKYGEKIIGVPVDRMGEVRAFTNPIIILKTRLHLKL